MSTPETLEQFRTTMLAAGYDEVPGPVHTIFASANLVKTVPIKARDDGQTGRLA